MWRNIINILKRVLRMKRDTSTVVYTSGGLNGKLIGKPDQIGDFGVIGYGGNVIIGKNVKIGYGVFILSVSTVTGTRNSKYIKKPIKIGNNGGINL